MKNEPEIVRQQPLPNMRCYPSTEIECLKKIIRFLSLQSMSQLKQFPFRQSSSLTKKWNIYKLIIVARRFSETSEAFHHFTPRRVPGESSTCNNFSSCHELSHNKMAASAQFLCICELHFDITFCDVFYVSDIIGSSILVHPCNFFYHEK